MPKSQKLLIEQIEKMKELAQTGFALALHINFTTPRLLLQTYDKDWVKYYSENGLVMSDPTVLWGFDNEGTKRWSELVEMDSRGLLELAANHGMRYGVTCAVADGDARSIGSFTRGDDDFNDDNLSTLLEQVEELHKLTADLTTLTPEQTQTLTALGVQVQIS